MAIIRWQREPSSFSEFDRLRRGHYAFDPQALAMYPRADITIERIGDLVNYDLTALLGANAGRRTALRVRA